MPGTSSSRSVPSNEAAGYGVLNIGEVDGDPQRVVDIGTETNSIIVRAPSENGGVVYVGFDDDLDVSNGFPLTAGDAVSFDVDTNQQGVFVVGDTTGDEIRWLALS